MQIILYQPEIPQNTGNILRTCHLTGCDLFIVPPLGFSLSSKFLKRAGLDYFNKTKIQTIENLPIFLKKTKNPFYFFSSKANKSYIDIDYPKNSILIFGSETKGLPPFFLEKWKERFVCIPMKKNSRCLNLSNAAAIAIYEALRQQQLLQGKTF